jgi:hypothetical protein
MRDRDDALASARDKVMSAYADLIGIKDRLPGDAGFLKASTLIGSAGIMLELVAEWIDKQKEALA